MDRTEATSTSIKVTDEIGRFKLAASGDESGMRSVSMTEGHRPSIYLSYEDSKILYGFLTEVYEMEDAP